MKAAPEIKATGGVAKNATPPADPIEIDVDAATAGDNAALPDNQQNNAGQEDGAEDIDPPPPPPLAATADSDATDHAQGRQQHIDADATQRWINEQHELRAAAGDEDIFEDEEEDENDVIIQNVIKNSWEKVKEAKI